MYPNSQEIIERLNININLFWDKLETGEHKKNLTHIDKIIICESLLGNSRQEIASKINVSEQNIRDRLSKYIYPKIATALEIDQEQIAGNWVLILNYLLDSKNIYKLNPAPQLNNDNFQGSFGRQVFLYPPNQEIVQLQIEGTKFYQQGLYYQAAKCFIWAAKKEKQIYGIGNPEVLIYINNCLLEYKQTLLQTRKIKVYTLAVVVPFYHNQGHVAAEILRGIAQIQFQINLPIFEKLSLDQEISLDDIKPDIFSTVKQTDSQIAGKILIVNDPNNLYNPYNQTAENLANLAAKLNLIAVLGHYSSEMTAKALEFYAQQGLVLVNSSSTSNQLSHISKGESLSFFRLTTQDDINALALARYLQGKFAQQGLKKVAVICNQNSSYCNSYKNSFQAELAQYPEQFTFLEPYGYISENYYHIQTYLDTIKNQGVDIIVVIPDGGLEPNSLDNAGLISRLNLHNCLIAGSATFYQENILYWLHEQQQYNLINPDECQIIACIPWHWHSQENGCNSHNTIAQQFCQIGTQLWGEENLTWRSATAFDAVLIIWRILERYHIEDSQSLLIHINQYFKEKRQQVQGVTGMIAFNKNGDRLHPPTEIVNVQWDRQKQKWQWNLKMHKCS